MAETDVFAKTHLQTLLARRLSLVLLCIKLWSVRGGGTVGVSKCIIMAFFWTSKSRLQRHMNGPKKAHNVYLTIQKSMKTSSNVFYKESVHIQDVAIKLTRVLKIVCYNPQKCPKRTFSRKCTCKPLWPGDISLALLCIKLL
jgi:hypothetical protein